MYKNFFVPLCLCGLLLTSAACAPKLLKLPSGPGEPAADVREALTEATSTCHGVTALSAEIGVSGSVGGERLRGRLLAALAAPASVRLEAVAPFGPPVFILVAQGAAATLLLPRDERVLEHESPRAVIEALTGVPADASDLRTLLTGCTTAADRETGRKVGDDWRIVDDGPTQVYLHRAGPSVPWQIAATVRTGAGGSGGFEWRAEYREHVNGLPRSVRVVSGDAKRFDLQLALSQLEVNTPLESNVFRVQIPRPARPITLEELQHARPGFRKN